MEVFVLHILKLNIIAAVVILLVKVFAALSKGKVSARWKYFIWLLCNGQSYDSSAAAINSVTGKF